MDFPIIDLMDEDACYAQLISWLHPEGLACPLPPSGPDADRPQPPLCLVRDYRCGHCGRVFNAFTGTALHGLRRRPRELVLLGGGIAQACPPFYWPVSRTATARSCSNRGIGSRTRPSGIGTGCRWMTRFGGG